RDEFDRVFRADVRCRLVLFRYRDVKKDPREAVELGSAEFRPSFGRRQTFEVERFLGSTTPGANFAIGNGLGVAVVVEKRTPGKTEVAGRAALQLHGVSLTFSPRE